MQDKDIDGASEGLQEEKSSNKDESFYISDSNNIERIALSILLSIQKLLKL